MIITPLITATLIICLVTIFAFWILRDNFTHFTLEQEQRFEDLSNQNRQLLEEIELLKDKMNKKAN